MFNTCLEIPWRSRDICTVKYGPFRDRTCSSLKGPYRNKMKGVFRSRQADCWEEHFLYNISQNIDSLKDMLQILWTLVGPLFKGQIPMAWYQKKYTVILYISYSTTVQESLSVLDISVQISFRGRTCNYLKGPHRNKMKGTYCSGIYSEQLLFYSAL